MTQHDLGRQVPFVPPPVQTARGILGTIYVQTRPGTTNEAMGGHIWW